MYIVEEHMRRRRLIKRISIVSVIILVICIAAGFLIHWYISQPDIKAISISDSYDDILYMESGTSGTNTLAVVTQPEVTYLRNRISPGKWVCTMDVDYYYVEDKEETTKIKKAVYEVYDIVSGKSIWTIDLKKLLEDNVPGHTISRPDFTMYLYKDGVYWARYMLLDTETDTRDMRIDINMETQQINLVNLETKEAQIIQEPIKTGAVQQESDDNTKTSEDEKPQSGIFFEDVIGLLDANGFCKYPVNFYNLYAEANTDAYGIKINYLHPGKELCVETLVKYLPEENEKLYSEFPGLKEYDGDGNDVVSLYLQEKLTEEEIMHLLMEDGEEITFDGCVLPAENSKDGKEREIHSFEEFYEWYIF